MSIKLYLGPWRGWASTVFVLFHCFSVFAAGWGVGCDEVGNSVKQLSKIVWCDAVCLLGVMLCVFSV